MRITKCKITEGFHLVSLNKMGHGQNRSANGMKEFDHHPNSLQVQHEMAETSFINRKLPPIKFSETGKDEKAHITWKMVIRMHIYSGSYLDW